MFKVKIAFTFLIITNFLFAAPQEQSKQSIFDLISQDGIPEITLTTDFSSIITNKKTSEDYHPGIFTFPGKSGKKSEFPVKVKARGKFRRLKCEFPPLKLKFKKTHLLSGGLDTFNKMKLVTHCLDDLSDNVSNIEREYLAYKIFNELTEQSFRVKLVRIKYLDQTGKRRPLHTYAFLIEEDEQVADRIGGELCDCYNRPSEQYNTQQAATAALFNYMIGNTDYDFRVLKNLKTVKGSDGKLTPVPYDFDFSVFVNPPYLNFENSKKTARVYKAFPLSAEEEEAVKEVFFLKKDAILNLIQNFKQSSRRERNHMTKYIERFYDELQHLDLTEVGIRDGKMLSKNDTGLSR